MAVTTVSTGNLVQQWSPKFFQEFVRDNPFAKLMGETTDAPIQMVYDLEKKPGEYVNVSFISRVPCTSTALGGATDDNVLRGQEYALGNFQDLLTLHQYRNAVTIGKMEQKKSHIDMLNAAKPQLKNWLMELVRQQCISALQSPNLDGITSEASSTAAQKTAWMQTQYTASRILIGHLLSYASTTYTTYALGLANIVNATDSLQPTIVALAKRLAEGSDPHMRPIRIDGGGEWFIQLCQRFAFRDFKQNSTTISVLEYAGVRGDENPLFNDGDLMYDGIVLKKVPEIAVISGAGASSIDVAPNFLIGAQALGFAIGDTAHDIYTKDEYDYGNAPGVGVAQIHAIKKLMFPVPGTAVQNGVLSVYTAGVADA
jgi:N4-gp56 family major capsid protein